MVNFVYAIGDRRTGECLLVDHVDCPVHVQHDEVEWVSRSTKVTVDHLVGHDSGDVLTVGGIDISLVHTPGHTPGSQCFFVDDRLIAGDTLFLEGCGRTDLPGSDPAKMAESLQRLGEVPDETILFPGHRYSVASSATMDVVKETNFVFQ